MTPESGLSRRAPFDQLELRRELRDRLAAVPSVSIPDEKLDKRPGMPMLTLSDPAALQQFVGTMEWVLERLDALAAESAAAVSGE